MRIDAAAFIILLYFQYILNNSCIDEIAHAINLLGNRRAKFVLEEGAADGKCPWLHILDKLEALVTVDAAGDAHRETASRHQFGNQLFSIRTIAIPQKVDAKDALISQSLGLCQHGFDAAFEDGGATRNLSHKGHVVDAVLLTEVEDGLMKARAHEHIDAAGGSHLSAFEAFCLRICHNLQYSALATRLHPAVDALHLFERQRLLLEAPIERLRFAALLKDLVGILHGEIIVGKHDDEFWFHSFGKDLG